MSSVKQVQSKVQSILTTELGSVRVGADNQIKINYESTLVTVEVEDYGNDETIVVLTAIVSTETKESPALYKYLNDTNSGLRFGSLQFLNGSPSVLILQYSILGDFLDPEELLNALRAVVLVADKLDDEIVGKFGGKRFID
jgi:hypothetical protein